jgi:hypothetical protein
MDRYQLLAAEIFGYSYANYEDHLGIGNIRYDKLMPDDAQTLERADAASWSLDRIAQALEVDRDQAAVSLQAYRRACEVVDAGNPAESFRVAVRQVLESATAKGLNDDESIEDVLIQICYRAADLAYLLDRKGKPLSRYSRHLRREPNVGYSEGYFDEQE